MGPKKEKLTKDQKLALKQAEEERQRLEEEQARKEAEEEERKRLEQERLRQEELEKIRLEEADIRLKEKSKLLPFFIDIEEKCWKNRVNDWNELQWYQYVNVWHTINPLSLPMINAFLSEWEEGDDDKADLKFFINSFHKSLEITEAIETALFNCPELDDKTESLWNEGLTNIKAVINKKVDLLSFLLLRNASDHLSSDSYNMEYGTTDLENNTLPNKNISPGMTLCLWVNFAKNLRYRGMNLKNFGIAFELPKSLVMESCAIRILHMSFDTVTENVAEVKPSTSESSDAENLSEIALGDASRPSVAPDPSQSNVNGASVDDLSLDEASSVAAQSSITVTDTLSSFVDSSSSELFPASDVSTTAENADPDIRSSSASSLSPFNMNLEAKESEIFCDLEGQIDKYVSLNDYFAVGGILQIDLVTIPLPPVEAGTWILVYSEEKRLKKIPYKTTITPIRQPHPDMSPVAAAEFSDAEIKRFDQEMSTAVTISFKLPNIVFLEKPKPAFWLEEEKCLSTDGIFDVLLEDTSQLSFKINQFGAVAMMQRRYANHPLQGWDLLPNRNNKSVLLTLVGKLLTVKLRVCAGGCFLELISFGEETILQQLYNTPFSAKQLTKKLQLSGINIEFFASTYMEVPAKARDIEEWTHRCMAVLSQNFKFSWSKWNRQRTSEEIVFHVQKEMDELQSLILVNSERAVYIANEDNDQIFSPESIPQQKFSSNVYHLLLQNFADEELTKIEDCDANYVTNLFDLLHICKIFSCS